MVPFTFTSAADYILSQAAQYKIQDFGPLTGRLEVAES
jgi:hypothetical protein